jgi:plasmid maintenance system antidote protein VapI
VRSTWPASQFTQGSTWPKNSSLRLPHFFGASAEFWLNLQSLYELRLAEAKSGKAIKKLPKLKHLDEARV